MTDRTRAGAGEAEPAGDPVETGEGSPSDSDETDATSPDRQPRKRYGRVVAVERVPVSEVPADYPVDIHTERALAVRLEFDEPADGDGLVHYEWPPADDGALERILDLRDVWQDRVEDLRGERIPVEVVDGYYVGLAPEEAPYGSAVGFYGLVAGIGGSLLLIGGVLAGVIPPGLTVATTLLLLNLVLLPTSTYVDGWYLRTRTDWEGNPLVWAAFSGFVGLNVLSVGAYLWQRRSALRY